MTQREYLRRECRPGRVIKAIGNISASSPQRKTDHQQRQRDTGECNPEPLTRLLPFNTRHTHMLARDMAQPELPSLPSPPRIRPHSFMPRIHRYMTPLLYDNTPSAVTPPPLYPSHP